MSEPSTAEVLPVLVTVGKAAFVWTPMGGLDPAAVLQLEGWITAKAARMRYVAAKAGYAIEDLVQEGRLGALEAARKYDPFHVGEDGQLSGCGFLTFAKFTMLHRMLDVLRRGDLTITKRQWDDLRHSQAWPSVASLDSSPIGDTTGSLKDFLAAPTSGVSPDLPFVRAKLRAALASLKPQDRTVLLRRFGFLEPAGDGETLEAIATDLGVTRQRVQQIEKRAHMRLRAALAKVGVTRW